MRSAAFFEEATPAAAEPITTFPLNQEMRRTRCAGNRVDHLVLWECVSYVEDLPHRLQELIAMTSGQIGRTSCQAQVALVFHYA